MPSEVHRGGTRAPVTVAVTGAAGAVGRRLLSRFDDDLSVERVVGIDVHRSLHPSPKLEAHVADLATADLKPLLEGVDVVVHLAHAVGRRGHDHEQARENVDGARRLLDAAGASGVGHVVAVSSATVYGAWPSNPVPLTEEATLRPNPGFAYAAAKAELERLCRQWRLDHPGTSVTVLRPAVALAEGVESWLARSLRAAARLGADDHPPAQFLDLDDLVGAVDLARRRRLDGVYNVAPDGWIEGEAVRALTGRSARPSVSPDAVRRLAAWVQRRRTGSRAPGIVAYTTSPWVVSNDRLRSAGWQPSSTNEEALVAARRGPPWSRLSPKRRQELALGAAGALVVGAAAGVTAVAVLLRSRRRA